MTQDVEFRESMRKVVQDVCDPQFAKINDRLDKIQNNELVHIGLDIERLKSDVDWMKKASNVSENANIETARVASDATWLKDIFWKLIMPVALLILGWMIAHIKFPSILD